MRFTLPSCVALLLLVPAGSPSEEPTPAVMSAVQGFSGTIIDRASPPPLPSPSDAEYRVAIIKDANAMLLFAADSVLRRYTIAVGNDSIGKATPSGRYKIVNKIKDPPMLWHDGTYIPPGDWRNSYGSRWMSLGEAKTGRYRGYGIHGTNAPHSVGLIISAGCIRMYDADVKELFDVVEIGTPVDIR
jgi:lipoprotein-anchoring transpeptidase ErfK/SrfK